MNGNDINNLAQRYKDEMMRLYKKSGGSSAAPETGMNRTPVTNSETIPQTSQSSSMFPRQAASARDAAGTPVPGLPGASFYGSNPDMATDTDTVNIPVNCDCRFPSAESIINSIAGTPVTLPLTPEDNPPSVCGPSAIMPRSSSAADTMNIPHGTGSGADNVTARSIMLNSSPAEATYTVPSESENEREIMPDFPLPADIPADSKEAVPTTASFLPSMSWVSLTGDNSWGFLQFDVFTAGGAYPVSNALVTVTKKLPSGSGLVRILFTDRNGRTPTIALPAPSRSLSQTPESTVRPFSEYNVTVRAKGFYTIKDINIPIFAGVKTVQPIDLIPLPEYGGRPQPRTDGNSITDSPSVG